MNFFCEILYHIVKPKKILGTQPTLVSSSVPVPPQPPTPDVPVPTQASNLSSSSTDVISQDHPKSCIHKRRYIFNQDAFSNSLTNNMKLLSWIEAHPHHDFPTIRFKAGMMGCSPNIDQHILFTFNSIFNGICLPNGTVMFPKSTFPSIQLNENEQSRFVSASLSKEQSRAIVVLSNPPSVMMVEIDSRKISRVVHSLCRQQSEDEKNNHHEISFQTLSPRLLLLTDYLCLCFVLLGLLTSQGMTIFVLFF